MKVAVLFYGQARYLDNPFPSEAYNRELYNKYACTTFVHSWWGRDIKEYECSTWVASSMHPDPNAVTKIIEKYAPTSLLVETPKQFEIPVGMEEYISTHFQYNQLNTRNILSHLYSISE